MGNTNNTITLTEDYLQQVIDNVSASLVGKLLKRFEIIENKSILKSEARELIYEEFRHLRDILLAYEVGLEISIFKFKKDGE